MSPSPAQSVVGPLLAVALLLVTFLGLLSWRPPAPTPAMLAPTISSEPPPVTAVPSASRIQAILDNLKENKNGKLAPKLDNEGLNTDVDPYHEFFLHRAARRRSASDLALCLAGLDVPHLRFIGDSVTRKQFNILMTRLNLPLVDGSHRPHDEQTADHVYSPANSTSPQFRVSFHFVTNMSHVPNLLKLQTTGAVVLNVGLWELKGSRDTSFMLRYLTEMANIALASRDHLKTPSTRKRLIWRDTAPILPRRAAVQLDEQRRSDLKDRGINGGIRNVRIRAANEAAGAILRSGAGFQVVRSWDLFAEGMDDPNLWEPDGMHPGKAALEGMLDLTLDHVCGERVDEWNEEALRELVARGREGGWSEFGP
ncbi:hypothetical protein HK101_011311 [Irineochytrium annulatum]|nr:hypothetical protein HK101_011311 [Irineochytrium annulatum]